jgi:hypothetical protein
MNDRAVENHPSHLLLAEAFAPITSEIGFIEADRATTVREYLDWQQSIDRPGGRLRLSERRLRGRLEDALSSLLPLVDIESSRHLFIPTASGWTAYLDNGWDGPDVFPPVSYLSERLGCTGVRAAADRHTMPRDERGPGQYGSVQLDVWGPDGTPPLMYVRSIYAANDGGRWVFGQSGTPYPFEETERYRARRIRDRFTFAMLRRYLGSLGLRAFDRDFYMPEGEATLVERPRSRAVEARGREFGLDAVRALRALPVTSMRDS